MKKELSTLLIFIFFTVCFFARFAMSVDVPMMTKDELKAMLGNPDLVILDLRLGGDYFSSDLKIKGAERPLSFHDLPSQYPNKTLVLYCASPQERTSAATAKRFIERGFTKVYVLKGGWEEWLKADYPTEKK